MNDIVINSSQFGQKNWWKIVRQFMKKKGINSDTIPPLTVNVKTYYSNTEKANVFNDFFVNHCKLENEDSPLPDTVINDAFEINEIILNVLEVKEIIKHLDSSKASGPDLIHNKLLIASAEVISIPLTAFFNRCLFEGKFPQPWKLANVMPIHKKGSKYECTNYRPISLLSCVGKLFERCVHKHVYNFLTSNIDFPSSVGVHTRRFDNLSTD